MARLAQASEPGLRAKLLISAVLFVLIPAVTPGPTGSKDSPVCVSFCKEPSKFLFAEGRTYYYDYNTDISTSVIGGSSLESRIHLSAKAEFSAISPCEIQLELKNVRLEESEPENRRTLVPIPNSREITEELQKHPLRFSFQDGKVENVCTSENDPIWVLNIKRGIISTLQNSMNKLTDEEVTQEVDISGRCFTKYELIGQNIKKTKDLKSCGLRHSHVSAIQSVAYSSNSPTQSIPLLSGKQECIQTIRSKRVDKVECSEEHIFQPFEKSPSGGKTMVTQKLQYTSDRPNASSRKEFVVTRTSTLLFETQKNAAATEMDINSLLSLLESLERESVPQVSTASPDRFIELVEELRMINYDALRSLYIKVSSKVGHKFLLDAMPLVGSAPSLAFMTDLYSQGKLSEEQIDSWLTSLSFIKHPRLEMISSLKPMLDGEPRNQALLGISSVVYAYCQNHENCMETNAVHDTVKKMISYLGTSCKAANYEADQVTRMLFALKAIGNAGRIPTESSSVLPSCFKDKYNPIEIRLAAIDAYRRVPCGLYSHHELVKLYTKMDENTEIRIHAYLVAMKCPDRELIDAVKDTLYTDAVNQVGSFVWTHLTNLQETSSPDKQALRELLSNDFLKNKFNTDARKYSRNYEGAKFWEEQNVGAGVDANLLFSPDSFLPREAMVNLTVHLFGESVNLIEFGARVHDLEQLLEPVFGPQGYFPDKTLNEALYSMRTKRDTSLQRLGAVYNQAGGNEDKLAGGSFYTRIFGNEISYKSFEINQESNVPQVIDESGKNWLDITRLLDNLSTGKSTEFTKSTIMMDSSYTVATSAGIPLSLGVQSAATVGIKANGKVDLSSFWESKEIEVEGLLRPSAAVQVYGIMSVQLGKFNSKVRSGLKLQNTLHTSTAVQTRVAIKGKQVIHASLNLPEKKQEIFEAKSQLLILRASGKPAIIEQGDSATPAVSHKICSPDVLATALGVKLCGEATIPDQFTFPMTSPAAIAVYLEKTDEFESYELDYKWTGDEQKTDLSLLFNTPGSQVDRRLAATFFLDRAIGKMEGSFEVPTKSFHVEGRYADASQSLQLTVKSGQEQVVLVNAAMRLQSTRMEPSLMVIFYKKPVVEIQGVVDLQNIVEQDGKANFDLTLTHLTQTPIRFNGEVARIGEVYDTQLGIQSYLATGTVRSQFRVRDGLISCKSEVQYEWKKSHSKTVSVSGKLQRTNKGALTKYSAQASLSSPQYPDNDFDISWETQKSLGYCENSAKVIWGKSTWESKALYKTQFSRGSQDVQFKVSFLAPKNNMDYAFDFSHLKSEAGIITKLTARTDSRNELRTQLEYLTKKQKLMDKSLRLEASWPKNEYILRSAIKEVRAGEFEGDVTITPNRAPEKKATLAYRNKSTRTKLDHSVEFRARGFLQEPVSATGSLSASDKLSHLGFQAEVEGRKKYSGRWSGNLDYNSSKKNVQKLEGKLAINEKKYTGEVNFRQAKSGERSTVTEIKIHNGRHIYCDMRLKGSVATKLTGSITLVPDRSANPTRRASVEGSLSADSASLRVNYYGDITAVSGTYTSQKVKFEAEWDNNKRIAMSVDAPSMTAERAVITSSLETSFDGLRNLGFTLQHNFDGKVLDTKVQGRVGQKTAEVSLEGTKSKRRITGGLTVEASGFDKLSASLDLTQSEIGKKFESKIQFGNEQSVLTLENSALPGGQSSKIDFSGCTFIPKFLVEASHQATNEVESHLKIQWTPAKSNMRQVHLQVTGQKDPMNYAFLLATPWKNVERFGGSFALKTAKQDVGVELQLTGNADILPFRLNARVSGSRENFKHHLTLNWSERKREKYAGLSIEGRLMSFKDAILEVNLEIPHHQYKMQLASEDQHNQKHKIYSELMYDSQRIASGITWSAENAGKKVEATVWVEYPEQPKIMINIEHNRNDKLFLVKSSFGQGSNHDNHFTVKLEHEGFKKWDLEANINSSLNFIPNLKITSKHSMLNLREIQHISEMLIHQKSTKRWGGRDQHKGSLEFNVRGGRHVDGALVYNGNDIRLKGEVELQQLTKRIDIELTSSMFETLRAIGSVGNSNPEKSISFSANRKNVEIMNFKASTRTEKGKTTGSLNFKCPFGHQVDSEVELDRNQKSVKFTLNETKKQLIQLTFEGQALYTRGKVHIDLQSKLHPLIEKLKVQVNYKKESGRVELQGSYEDRHGRSALSGVGVYTSALKKLHFSSSGKYAVVYDLEILENSKLTGSVVNEGRTLVSIEGDYRKESEGYALGKHVVTAKVVTQNRKSYDFSTTLGIDVNRLTLDIQTPFESMKEFTFDAEMTLEHSRKFASLGFKLNGVKYDGKIEGKFSDDSGKLILQARTPIKGYSSIDSEIEFNFDAGVNVKLDASIEKSHASFKYIYASGRAEIEITTPYENLKHTHVSAQWDFKNSGKFLNALAQLNEYKYEFSGKWNLSSTQGQANISVTGFENASLDLNYDFTQGYSVSGTLEIFGKKHGANGRVRLGAQDIHVQIHAPFAGLENSWVKAEYSKPSTGRHHKVLQWNLNGSTDRLELTTTFNAQGVQFNLQTPFQPWSTVSGSLDYNFQQTDKQVSFKAQRGDGKSVEFSLKTKMQGYFYQLRGNFESSITLELDTPIPGMEVWQVEAAYSRQGIRHIGKVMARKNSDRINGRFTVNLQTKDAFHMDIDSEFLAPVLGLKETRFGGTAHWDLKGESNLKGALEYSAKKYELEGSFNLQPSQLKFEGKTTFSSLSHLLFTGKYDNSGNAAGSFDINGKKMEFDLKVAQNGIRNSKVVFELKTPFSGYNTVHAEAEVQMQHRNGRVSFSFQNDRVRYMGKAAGHYSKSSGEFTIQFNSPVYKYEQILASMEFSPAGAQAKLERNTKEEVNAEIILNEGSLVISLVSKLQSYPVNTRSVIDWSRNPFNLKIHLDAGSKDHLVSIKTNIEGTHLGELAIITSFKGYEHTSLKWQLERAVDGGLARISYDLPKLGKKSFRSSWKREDFQAMKAELWMNTGSSEHEKGFTLQYSLATARSGGGKFGASITYVLDKKEEQVTISTAVKRADPTNTLEFTLQTPFSAVKDITINGRLLTQPDISIDLTASHNQEKVMTLQTSVHIDTLASKFKLNFNAPRMSDAFNLDTEYDLTMAEKFLKIYFQQGKHKLHVKAQAIVPNNPQEIELRMDVDSNVPSVTVSASGSLRASYKIESDGTRRVTVVVESLHTGHWSTSASFRPLPNFNAQFRLDSPIPERVPPVKADLEWSTGQQGVHGGFSMQLGSSQIRSTLTAGSGKLRATFNSPIPGYEEFLAEGKLESGQGHMDKKTSLEIRAGHKYAKLSGEINLSSNDPASQASLKLESSWEQIPEASLIAKMEANGDLNITGKWGQRNIQIGGNVSPGKGGSLKNSAVSTITFAMDGEQMFQVQSNHYFNQNEYSWNASLGQEYKFESYIMLDESKNVLKSKIQWADHQIIVNGDIGSGRFGASVSTPWSNEMQTNGQYTVNSNEYSARGYFTYDGVRSGIEAQVLTHSDSFSARMNVDIPILKQKMEASIKINKPDDKNVNGDLFMKAWNREVSVKGSLLTNKYTSSQFGRMVEQTLKLSLSIPNADYPEMSTELVVRKPINGFTNMEVEGSVSLPTGTSKAAFRYEIPTASSKRMAAEWLIDSRLISQEIIKGAVQADNVSVKAFDGQLRYKDNEIKVLWDLSSQFRIDASAHMPALLQESSPLRFSAEGTFDWPTEATIRSTASCSKSSANFEASVVKQDQGYNTRIFIDSPRTMTEPQEIVLKLQQAGNGRFVADFSGIRGKKSLSAFGELISQDDLVSLSGKVSGSYGAHFIQVSGNRNGANYGVEMSAESLSLLKGKKVTVSGKVHPTRTGFTSNLECRTKKSVHSASLNADFQARSGIVSMKLNSPEWEPVLMEAQYMLDQDEIRAKIMANVNKVQHQIEASLNRPDLEAKFYLECPYLFTKAFNAHLKSVVEKNNVNIVGDLGYNTVKWRFEGTAKYDHIRNMQLRLEVVTPFESFDRFTIAAKIAADELLLEVYTPLENFPNSMFQLSGVPLFDKINPTNFHPKLIIGLPWVTYTAGGSFQVPNQDQSGKVGLMFEQKYAQEDAERYEGTIHLTPLGKISFDMDEPMKIKFEAKTPIEGYKVMEFEVAGNLQWKRWADLKAVCEFRGNRITLISQVRNEGGNKKILIELTTPFKKHERLAILGHIENYEEIGAGQSIQLEFQHPLWTQPISVELDYRYQYNGLTDMEAEIKLAAPSLEMEPLLLRMKSALKDSLYVGVVEGTWGDQHPSLKLDAGAAEGILFASLEGKAGVNQVYQGLTKLELISKTEKLSLSAEVQMNYEQLLSTLLAVSKEAGVVEAEARIKTPYDVLRSSAIVFRLSPVGPKDTITFDRVIKNLDVTAGASYNGQKLIHVELVSRNGRRSLEVHNPFRPVALSIHFERQEGQKMDILAEVCWNLKRPIESTMGVGIKYDRKDSGQDITFKIHAGEKGMLAVDVSHSRTPDLLDQSFKVRWNRPKEEQDGEAGYSVYFKDASASGKKAYDMRAQLDMPWRSVALESEIQTSDEEYSKSLQFKWDVRRDATKRLGGKLVREKKTGWRSHSIKQAVTLIHSALPHDMVFAVEKNYRNNAVQLMEITVQPNSFPQDTLTFRFARGVNKNKDLHVALTHPSTNIDITVVVKESDATKSFHITHMDIHGVKYVLNMEATSDDQGAMLDINAGPEDSVVPVFQLEYRPQEEQQTFSLKSTLLDMNVDVNNVLPLVKASLKYDSGRVMDFQAGLPHNREIMVKLSRSEYGMKIKDILMSIRLNTSTLLSTTIQWRPEIIQDLKQAITFNIPKSIQNSADYHIPRILAILNDEVEERLAALDPSLVRLIKSFSDFTKSELQALRSEMERVAKLVEKLHQKNSFYMKDMTGLVSSVYEMIMDIAGDSIETVRNAVREFVKAGADAIAKIKEMWSQYSGSLEKVIMPMWDEAEKAIQRLWTDYFNTLSSFVENLKEVYETLKHIIEGNMEALEKKIRGVGILRKINRLYKEYAAWIEELPIQKYIDEAREMFRTKVLVPLERYYKPYFDTLTKAIEDGNLIALLEMPPLPYLRHVSTKIMGLLSRAWIFVEAEQRIKGLVKDILKRVDAIIQRHVPTATMIWDTEKGHIAYHQPLNILEWQDFTQMPQFKQSPQDAADENKINEFYFDILDTIRNTQPVLDMKMREILPPFGAEALMAGDHHYYTFDKKYFRFAGECSYVLVADLLHQNFTLLVNYENHEGAIRKKSFSLLSGSRVLEIETSSLKVTIDGRKTELPVEVGPTTIRRQPHGLEIFDSRGFQMKCTESPSICTVSVSGWYFGKLGGLLGTYDNEASNDMKSPDGQVLTEVSNFAHSWRVGHKANQCRMKNFAVESSRDVDVDGVCSQMLTKKNSPLRPCFNVVDTAVFMQMCKHDTSRNINSANRQESMCTAVGAYVRECQSKGIDLWMPPTCVRCKLEDGSAITSGENMTFSAEGPMEPVKSADIVFLIEEASALRSYNLNEAVSKLDTALQAEGLKNNRYTVIGFGGQGARNRPHIRTSAGQVWSHGSLFRVFDPDSMNGPGNGDLYEAMEYASTIGFRAGVSKTMIALVADNDRCGDEGRYSDALTLLLENDFRLHMLTPEDFTMKTAKKQEDATTVLGVDIDGVYTIRNANRPLEADTTIKRHLKLSKDFCSPLAIETTGTRFNIKQMQRFSKKFIDVWSRRVAKTSQPSECQRCECLPNRNGGDMLLCHQCVSPNLQKFMDDFSKYEEFSEQELLDPENNY